MFPKPSVTDAAPVVVITGASGGLGRALTIEFALQNWRVVAAFHRHSPADVPENILTLPWDVTSAERGVVVMSEILERWGRVDVLINNAGITADQLTPHMTESDWDRVVQVNLKGAFLSSRAVLPMMAARREGHIINISSFAARHGTAGQANYAAAKAGLIGLTQSLAREMGPQNIRVNAVLPGVLPTPLTASASEKQQAAWVAANALGRLNETGEAAKFIVHLAGMKNASGQVFQLDSRVGRWC